MRKIKRLAVLTMAVAMIFTGCGKSESVSKQDSGEMTNYSSNTKKEDTQEKATTSKEIQKVSITTYEELDAYETDRMKTIISAFEDNGISYGLTDNHRFIYNQENTYQILDNDYDIYQVGYSMYNANTNVVDTVVSFNYEFHPEKGLSSDNINIKMLYSFIHTTDNAELKEKYRTCEELVAELMTAVDNETTNAIYNTENSRLTLNVENTSKYIINFAEVDRVSCNIAVQTEPTYKEFVSYREYEDYIRNGLKEGLKTYILSGNTQIIDCAVDRPVPYETDPNTLIYDDRGVHTYQTDMMTVYLECGRHESNLENNFEINVYLKVEFDENHIEETKKYVGMIIQYLQEEKNLPDSIDMQGYLSEIISHTQIMNMPSKILYDLNACQWFGVNLKDYRKYYFMKDNSSIDITINVPVKVEGLLNG